MESHCEYFMYFPAAPIFRLSDAAQYATLPRRKHVYLGETVQVLLVLRARSADSAAAPPWKGPAGSLAALASVCDAESRQRSSGQDPPDSRSSGSEDSGEEEPGAGELRGDTARSEPRFRACSPLLSTHSPAGGGLLQPGESVLLLDNQVVFCLTVTLDKLPVNTRKAKVVVTVWRQNEDRGGQLLEHGYLTLLQLQSPAHTFRQDRSAFKTQVSTTLEVLPPPSVQCQQITVSGKFLTILKVLNLSSQEEMYIQDVKILPNYNSSYLPMMPDGSVLIVDNVCHRSAEVFTASFCRVDRKCSRLPSMLSALEEHNFLFQLELQDQVEDSSEGLELKLLAVLQWYTPTLPLTRYISTCYTLPSICLDRPRLVMTASCPRTVRPLETFWVRYTLINDLQDFLAVRLLWNSEAGQEDSGGPAVVCRSPLINLGRCRKGSSLSISVTFQILRSGLYELSQHMKMKLLMSASACGPALLPPSSSSHQLPPSSSSHQLPPSSSSHQLPPSSSSHQLPPSSSSHQQTSSSPRFRSGSSMEDGGSVFCPQHTTGPTGRIAKRECKVLVLEPVQETPSR